MKPTMNGEYILETRGLTKEFKGFVAVNDRGGPVRLDRMSCSISDIQTIRQPAVRVPQKKNFFA